MMTVALYKESAVVYRWDRPPPSCPMQLLYFNFFGKQAHCEIEKKNAICHWVNWWKVGLTKCAVGACAVGAFCQVRIRKAVLERLFWTSHTHTHTYIYIYINNYKYMHLLSSHFSLPSGAGQGHSFQPFCVRFSWMCASSCQWFRHDGAFVYSCETIVKVRRTSTVYPLLFWKKHLASSFTPVYFFNVFFTFCDSSFFCILNSYYVHPFLFLSSAFFESSLFL